MGVSHGEQRERNKKNTWSDNGWEFSKIIDRFQTTDPGSLENTKHGEYQKIYT